VKIKKSELKAVLKAERLFQTPRKVGNPRQSNVSSWKDYFDFIKNTTGRAICFTSHNWYPEFNALGDPTHVEVDKFFSDLDDEHKIENAQRDTLRLVEFAQSWKLPYFNNFSGRKGYHNFILLDPKRYELNEELTMKLHALHNWIAIEGAKIKTMDKRCKDVKRLCRIPLTKYVTIKRGSREYIVGDTYCCPIQDDLLDMQPSDIIEYSRDPNNGGSSPFIPKPDKPKLDLDQLIDKLGINVQEWALKSQDEGRDMSGYVAPINKAPKNEFIKRAKKEIGRPCIINDLLSRNPTHDARRIAVILLKRYGHNFQEIILWFDKMAQICKWVDRGNRTTRTDQIRHIYFRVPEYKPDGCGKIKTKNLCPYPDKRETKYPRGKCKKIEDLI
jgi:hypothetical protein